MQEYSTSSVKEVILLQPSTSGIVPIAERITQIASYSQKTNKRDFSNAMDIEEKDTTRAPKKQNVKET